MKRRLAMLLLAGMVMLGLLGWGVGAVDRLSLPVVETLVVSTPPTPAETRDYWVRRWAVQVTAIELAVHGPLLATVVPTEHALQISRAENCSCTMQVPGHSSISRPVLRAR